jgi:hypothetical protein
MTWSSEEGAERFKVSRMSRSAMEGRLQVDNQIFVPLLSIRFPIILHSSPSSSKAISCMIAT